MQVTWNVICRSVADDGSIVVGAKWRREVPPSRRLTAREQSLPWAILSFPAHRCRVNRPDLGVGTPAATVACSKAAKTGSCRAGPRPVTAARPVRKPHAAGAAGFPANAIEATNHGKERRREQARRYRIRLQQRSSLAEPAPPAHGVELASPVVESQTSTRSEPTSARLNTRARASAQPKYPNNLAALPCHRPGCYVLFLPSARSPDQRFCSSPCRQALRRVRQRELRLRQRRERGGSSPLYPSSRTASTSSSHVVTY